MFDRLEAFSLIPSTSDFGRLVSDRIRKAVVLTLSTRRSPWRRSCTTPQLLAVDLATTLAIAIESLSATSSASFDIATFDM